MGNKTWFKNKSKKALFIYIFGVVFLAIFILEYSAARILIQNQTDISLRASYYSQLTWSDDFLREYNNFIYKKNKYIPYVIYGHREFTGKLLTIDSNGLRKTINRIDKDKPKKIIYIFGGSTTFGAEVKNDLTIASFLSNLLNVDNSKYSYEVINFGTSGYNTTNEVLRLYLEAREGFYKYGKPDHIIFYDGVNDVQNGIYNEIPGSHYAYRDVELRYNDIQSFVLGGIIRRIYNNSSLLQLIFQTKNGFNIGNKHLSFNREKNYTELSVRQKNIYKFNALLAQKLSSMYNISTHFFLQPTLFTSNVLNKEDIKLKEDTINSLGDIHTAFEKGYIQFKELANDSNFHYYDLTDILSNKSDERLFLDYAHTTHNANRMIAQQIYKIIGQKM